MVKAESYARDIYIYIYIHTYTHIHTYVHAQVALSVPARDFHAAARELILTLTPFPSNGTVPQALLARRALLKSVMRLGRMRAAEICREKGSASYSCDYMCVCVYVCMALQL
jgi:hypothetical protein